MPDADRLTLSDLPRLDDVDFWSLRFVEEHCETFAVRKNIAMPFVASTDRGAMATVYVDGGYGYAATSDTSTVGLREALERAAHWARSTANLALFDSRTLPRPTPCGEYVSPSWADRFPSRREWYDLLAEESAQAGCDPRIVDWEAAVDVLAATHRLVTSAGGDVVQRYRFLLPGMAVTAHADGVTQVRTLNGYRGPCQQGGTEVLARFGFVGGGRRIAQEALELLSAPNCPSGKMDVMLAPDQMILQIHESIGHPLELDRILGDERNFAGTSFVTPDMFGSYRYGSDLLNVTFDPTRPEELASYAYDDDGTRAERVHLIRAGVLERPLGGAISQARAGIAGVANSRAASWNRPPIDRMANLNLEPGDATLEEMIAGIERGVLMETNSSWSIDDSRNKFQFGCERGQVIENGKLGAVVKNPNYRGISANFWRSLKRVGNAGTLQVLGTPHCGKGEPSQAIRVGHATPACVFGNVDVFGGESLMEGYFLELAKAIDASLQAGERYTASFEAEQTDFVRMNRGKVRQSGTVAQRYIAVRLIRDQRHAKHMISLTGDAKPDCDAIRAVIAGLRGTLPELADDPLLLLPADVKSTRAARGGSLPPSEQIIGDVLAAAHGTDLVGIYAGGPIWRGFANSEGQRNWHETTTFNLDWSLYFRADKAVKSGCAGFAWDGATLDRKMSDARERLALISRPAKSLAPGKYRAYLAPSAVEEIAQLLCWGGFSGRALATQQSSLARMQSGEALDERVTLSENTASGIAPAFQAEGFARPAGVDLVHRGALVGSLVSPRTAREFGLAENGANGDEVPESLSMAGGALAEKDALAALGTGLHIGNLHYLNYSDRPACRMTGMTRFATFWVDEGRIVAPIDVLRFDDTVYRLLGSNLEALTAETELLLDSSSYQSRKLTSVTLPGALVREMSFTL